MSIKNDYMKILPNSSFNFQRVTKSGGGGGGGGGDRDRDHGRRYGGDHDHDHGDHGGGGEPPRLIEEKYSSFMQSVLRDCHETKRKVYAFIFNAIVLFLFLCVFGSALYICRTNKLSPREKLEKQVRDKEYLLSKIRSFETEQAKGWFDEYVSPLQRARQESSYFL